MAGPTEGPVRHPAVAGSFYPDDPQACRDLARRFIEAAPLELSSSRWIGGIVPHAGWVCSGAIAAQTVANLAASWWRDPGAATDQLVIVVFGAVHVPLPLSRAALDTFAGWRVPGEVSHVAVELRQRARSSGELFCADDRFHEREHAVEVELPLIQQAFADAAILPVQVPLIEDAVAIGIATARCVRQANRRALFLASSDLTHYGPAYQFVPAGVGINGLDWARDNDRRLLDRIEHFEVERIVYEVMQHQNACGGGAIAAMLAACREFGATQARVLRHASSYQTLADVAPQPPDNAVGYSAALVG